MVFILPPGIPPGAAKGAAQVAVQEPAVLDFGACDDLSAVMGGDGGPSAVQANYRAAAAVQAQRGHAKDNPNPVFEGRRFAFLADPPRLRHCN
ncbi:hypothetical protein [Mycolicibacterium moriokaense]|uniref:hypothetical protein n=1 Tax=Mycolicibacterium moriokaense TaxID=39691 RepID=UPI0011B3DDA7|nr:hypothetical protein [Mycolicibacterium moriokaense]